MNAMYREWARHLLQQIARAVLAHKATDHACAWISWSLAITLNRQSGVYKVCMITYDIRLVKQGLRFHKNYPATPLTEDSIAAAIREALNQ